MSSESENESSAREALSALTDGRVEVDFVARACDAWRDDASMRSTWHAYHLIGDVLRSEDLAASAEHDAAFLALLRARLAHEPTVLAPDSIPLKSTSGAWGARRSWVTSIAAAGLGLTVGALLVSRAPLQMAVAPSPAASSVIAEPQTLAVDGGVVRDARLDQYLAAHQQFSGSTVLGVPSGFLRNAAAEKPGR